MTRINADLDPKRLTDQHLMAEYNEKSIKIWLKIKKQILENAIELNDLGLHKQLVNRLIEPFLWHTVVVTSTEWDNFFEQRHPSVYYPGPCQCKIFRQHLMFRGER